MVDLSERLKAAMLERGAKPTDLARALGVSIQAVRKSLDGSSKTLSAENTFKAAEYLGVSPKWLATGEGPAVSAAEFEDAGTMSKVRRVPIVGTAKMGDDGFYEEISAIPGAGDGHIEIATSDPNAYGLRCRGMSMFPAIRDGWYVIVEPNRSPAVGEYVLIKLRDGRKMVKELLFERPTSFEVMSVNEAARFTLDKAELDSVQAVGPIVPPSAWRPD